MSKTRRLQDTEGVISRIDSGGILTGSLFHRCGPRSSMCVHFRFFGSSGSFYGLADRPATVRLPSILLWIGGDATQAAEEPVAAECLNNIVLTDVSSQMHGADVGRWRMNVGPGRI